MGKAQRALAITPPPVTISGEGVNAHGGEAKYELSGRFMGKDVYLGEVRTDERGRLVFLGGRGVSASADGSDLTTFANNAGWHDDVSDGPVDATVEYNGRTYQATGAWVLVGPPDYAPGVQGIVTGYDLLFDVATQIDPALMPAQPSFSANIYPLLRRFTQNQWVNAGFARDFGFGTPADFSDPAFVARLGDPSAATRTLRTAIFGWFRKPTYPYPQPSALPAYYGDGMTTNVNSTDPRQWMAIFPTQYRWLAQWAAGEFAADGPPAPPPRWDSLSAADQVKGIDRAVLDEVLGGPFHPGAEFTWPMRRKILYSAPFRIKRRTSPAPSWGTQLVGSVALMVGGPLDGSAAGDVTRWMAVPWQADTSSCLSGYIPYVDDYLPTFWPARVPNDVMSSEQYAILMDPHAPLGEKEHVFAFHRRVKWLRGIRYPMKPEVPPKIFPSKPAINKFLHDWWKVGIIEVKRGRVVPCPRRCGSRPAANSRTISRRSCRSSGSPTRSRREMAAEVEADAVVVGAGPAGCTAAILLAEAGWRVVVFGRPPADGDRIGESLSPGAPALLERLGLRTRFLDDGPLLCHANASAWGSPELTWHDFLGDPRGPGFHIDRARFEALLAARALEAGAHLVACEAPRAAARDAGSWHLAATTALPPIAARYLVDASGRSACLARTLGARREVAWEQVALVAFARAPRPSDETFTVIEAVPEGFWYSAPIPGRALRARAVHRCGPPRRSHRAHHRRLRRAPRRRPANPRPPRRARRPARRRAALRRRRQRLARVGARPRLDRRR